MSHKNTPKTFLSSVKKHARTILAVSATLVFGASLIGLMQYSLNGEDRGLVLAEVFDGSFVNICGTNPPSGDWGQHNANPACQGCHESGYCSGNAVWVFSCNPGEEYSSIECRANGVYVGNRADFDPTFNDPCKMYQIDVFEDGPGGTLHDFVVWEGKWFREPLYSQYCLPNPVCPYNSTQARVHETIHDHWQPSITVDEGSQFIGGGFHNGTGQFADDITLRVTRPNGTQFDILNGEAVTNLVVGTYTLHVYTNGYPENEPNCFEIATVTVEPAVLAPNFACDTKTVSQTLDVVPGQELQYSVVYTAEDLLSPLAIFDRIPSGTQYISGSATGADNCQLVTNLLLCSANISGTLTFRVRVNDDFTGQEITNTAYVVYENEADYCNTVSSKMAETELVCDNKTADKQEVAIGDVVTFSINYSNTSNILARDILGKELYLGESYANLRSFRVEMGGQTYLLDPILCNETAFLTNGCPVPDLASNASAKLIFEADIVGIDDLDEIAYLEFNGGQSTNYCPFTPPTPIESELVCDTKTADKQEVKIGDDVTFTIKYSNTSRVKEDIVYIRESTGELLGTSFTNVRNLRTQESQFADEIPYAGCTVEDLTGNGCQLPALEGNESVYFLFDVTVTNLEDLRNQAIIRYGEHGTEVTSEACSITLTRIDPAVDCIEKTAEHDYPSDIKVGDTVNYTINYTSTNQPEGESVSINDILDSDLEFVSFLNESEDYCTYDNDTREISCSVPANQTGEISYSAVIINEGAITNQAEVTDNYGHSESDGCRVDFDARALIDELVCVSKTADDTHMNYGDEGDFVITYQNVGETTLNGVILHDTLPLGMKFVSAEDDLCRVLTPEELAQYGPAVSAATDTIQCENTDDLEPRDRAVFRFTVRINDEAPAGGSLVNEVSSLFSRELIGDISACTEKIFINLPKPSVIVEKETKSPADRTMVLGDDAETPEDYVRFRITVTNDGPTTLVEVPLYDKFYADDYEFVSATPAPDSIENIDAARPLVKLFWNDLGELAPGESTIVEVVLKALETHSADKLINYTKVEDAVDENGIVIDSNIDDDYVIIEGSILGEQLNFNIIKILVTENPTREGEVVKFHIVITNTGTKTIEKIKLVDDYDPSYLEFTDFSAEISHDSSLYSVDAGDGIFTHLNILSSLDFLEPGEDIELDIWFLAKNKKGETINLATAYVEDMTDYDTASVTIIVEELADTGSNILIPLVIGVLLTTLGVVGVKYLKKRE